MRIIIILTLAFLMPLDLFAASNCPIAVFQPLRSLQEGLQSLMGGKFLCSSFTVDEVTDYTRHCPFHPSSPITTSDDLAGLAAGMFYQSLAANSHRQANCRVGLFDKYASDQAHRDTLNAAAAKGFENVKDKLAQLLQQRAGYQNFMKTFDDPRYLDRGMFEVAAEGREATNKDIAKVDESIARLMLNVPMGYDPDVAHSLMLMGSSGQFNTGAFEKAMTQARGKYAAAAKYYADKFSVDPDTHGGSYCLGLDFKNLASQTGETKTWLDQLPGKSVEERDLRDKLACRLGATYNRGRKVNDKVLAVASYGVLFIPGAGEAEGASMAMAATATALRVTSAVDTVMSINFLRQQCFPPDGFTSSDVNACNPEQDFQKTLNEPSLLACGEIAAQVGGMGYAFARKSLLARNARASSPPEPPVSPPVAKILNRDSVRGEPMPAVHVSERAIEHSQTHMGLTGAQQKYLDRILKMRGEGKLTKQEEVDYWLDTPSPPRVRHGTVNPEFVSRPFRGGKKTPVFPEGVTREEVVAKLKSGQATPITRTTADAENSFYRVDYKGNRYEVIVCNVPACKATQAEKDEVVSVFPECGPGVRAIVPLKTAKALLLSGASLTAASFYQAAPCGP